MAWIAALTPEEAPGLWQPSNTSAFCPVWVVLVALVASVAVPLQPFPSQTLISPEALPVIFAHPAVGADGSFEMAK
jgi:hypothetical protein